MDTAKQITVIETTLARRGDGRTSDSPIRVLTQYWTLGGELLGEIDNCAAKITPERLKRICDTVRQKLNVTDAEVICRFLRDEIKPEKNYDET